MEWRMDRSLRLGDTSWSGWVPTEYQSLVRIRVVFIYIQSQQHHRGDLVENKAVGKPAGVVERDGYQRWPAKTTMPDGYSKIEQTG